MKLGEELASEIAVKAPSCGAVKEGFSSSIQLNPARHHAGGRPAALASEAED